MPVLHTMIRAILVFLYKLLFCYFLCISTLFCQWGSIHMPHSEALTRTFKCSVCSICLDCNPLRHMLACPTALWSSDLDLLLAESWLCSRIGNKASRKSCSDWYVIGVENYRIWYLWVNSFLLWVTCLLIAHVTVTHVIPLIMHILFQSLAPRRPLLPSPLQESSNQILLPIPWSSNLISPNTSMMRIDHHPEPLHSSHQWRLDSEPVSMTLHAVVVRAQQAGRVLRNMPLSKQKSVGARRNPPPVQFSSMSNAFRAPLHPRSTSR
jgi:hypothetical protein